MHNDVSEVLESLDDTGFSQSILSAGKQEYLNQWVQVHGLSEFFTIIRGIDNQYARGKIELGASYINELPYEKKDVIMIGDTVHDSDVANAMKIDCLLINHGHMGDVNGDGSITSLDALLCVNSIFELYTLQPIEFLAADIDGTGSINIYDVLFILDGAN